MEFINKSDKTFTDISSEEWREYKTPFGLLRIEQPLQLSVTENGHRVFNADGISFYVDTRQGFFLSWKAKEGKPHFVK